MTNHIVDANKMVPPPHLLKKFSEQARVDSKKRGHSGYCKTFAKLCIDWALNSQPSAARRPKPPNLKEEALKQLDEISACFRVTHMSDIVCDKIRRALEALDD